jgi:hypothetical protein
MRRNLIFRRVVTTCPSETSKATQSSCSSTDRSRGKSSRRRSRAEELPQPRMSRPASQSHPIIPPDADSEFPLSAPLISSAGFQRSKREEEEGGGAALDKLKERNLNESFPGAIHPISPAISHTVSLSTYLPFSTPSPGTWHRLL